MNKRCRTLYKSVFLEKLLLSCFGNDTVQINMNALRGEIFMCLTPTIHNNVSFYWRVLKRSIGKYMSIWLIETNRRFLVCKKRMTWEQPKNIV